MQVFLINLERDVKRLQWIKKQFEKIDLEFQRFPALTAESIEDWQRSQFYKGNGSPCGPLEPGEIGCYASHLALHKLTAENPNGDPTLILEDDVAVNPDLTVFLRQVDKLPAGWDIIRLSNPPKAAYVPLTELDGGLEVVQYWRIPNNMGSYLISPKGAQKFLKAYEQRTRPIDEDMRRPWEHQMNTYGIVPAPVLLNAFEGSSIDDIAQRTDLPWRKRRQKSTPSAIPPMIRHKLKYFGVLGSLRCLAKNTTVSIGKRLSILDKDYKSYRIPQK